MKGAPEVVVKKCTYKLSSNDEEIHFHGIGDEGEDFLKHAARIASFGNGRTPILYAYRDISIEDYEDLKRKHNNFSHETDRLILEENLTLLAMYGLKDTIRDDVPKTIEVLASASTRTRIVSGDHEMTVKSLAKSLEIVDCEDDEDAIISGKEFEKKCEKYMTQIEKEDGSWDFNFNHETHNNELTQELFKGEIEKLHGLYRCDPKHKQMFVTALNLVGKIAAVTGRGISDIHCL
jgi:magnesium-transporting ATPase (P-type)